jgi:hypothetical protein
MLGWIYLPILKCPVIGQFEEVSILGPSEESVSAESADETVSKLKTYPVLMIIRFLEIYLECASLLAPYSINDY